MPNFIRPISLRLPNNEIERRSTWLELFFDLVFVIIMTELGVRLFDHLTYLGVLQCSALFIPVMWTWASYTVFAARFDNDDIIHWIMTFVIMFAGIIMAIHIPVALEKGATRFSTGFLISQIAIILLYVRTAYDKSTPKNITLFYVVGFGCGCICWIISLFFAPPIKFIWWTLGMIIYLSVPWIGRKKILSQAPLDPVYIPERFGLFTIIILGETITSVVFGLKSANWNLFSLLTSILAFILAIIIWGQYYRFTRIADYKCTLSSGQSYIYAHIPLIISMIIMGVCAEVFITTPFLTNKHIYIIFAFAAILYLSSFYLLQYIAIRKFKIRGIAYVAGVIAIIFLFSFHSDYAVVTLLGLVCIFALLFAVQYWLGYKYTEAKK